MPLPTWSIILAFGLLISLFVISYLVFQHAYWLLKGNPWLIGFLGGLLMIGVGWLLAELVAWYAVMIWLTSTFPIYLCYLHCLIKHRREKREVQNEL